MRRQSRLGLTKTGSSSFMGFRIADSRSGASKAAMGESEVRGFLKTGLLQNLRARGPFSFYETILGPCWRWLRPEISGEFFAGVPRDVYVGALEATLR